MMNVIGKLIFDPGDKTKKHTKQSSWKRVAMIQLNCDLHLYYAWFILKRYNLPLNKPIRGTHVTIISDKVPNKDLYFKVKEKYNGKDIEFEYEISPRTNGEHWWLKVYSEKAKEIRKEIGLSEDPYFAFHITLGYANEKNIEHSRYIHRLFKKGLI